MKSAQVETHGEVIAIDGKTVRGSYARYQSRCKIQQAVRCTDSRQEVEGLTSSINTS